MRRDAGLLLPDRRIGLSAHDYQQAVAAERVVFDARHTQCRVGNRSVALGQSVDEPDERRGGTKRANGLERYARAGGLFGWNRNSSRESFGNHACSGTSGAMPTVGRKAPQAARDGNQDTDPRPLWNSTARYILRLRKLDPLHPLADARLRGQVLHKVLERFVKERVPETREQAKARLAALTQATLEDAWLWRRPGFLAGATGQVGLVLDQDGADGGISVNLEQAGTISAFSPGI